MYIRLMPLVSTEDWAVIAPIPVRTSGVSLARSNPVRQVADPRTTSPVLVSVIRMDQVAEAGDAVSERAANDAERVAILEVRERLWVSVVMVFLGY